MRIKERQRIVRQKLGHIIRTLKSHDLAIEMRWLFDDPRIQGLCDSDGATNGHIRIDPFKEMVSTLIHEILHHLYDKKMSHREIYALEALIMRHATPKQLLHLFGFLALRWRMTITDMYRGKSPMPPCPLCGQKIPRVPGGDGSLAPNHVREEMDLDEP